MEIEKDWGSLLSDMESSGGSGGTENSYDTTDSLGDLVLETTELGDNCPSRLLGTAIPPRSQSVTALPSKFLLASSGAAGIWEVEAYLGIAELQKLRCPGNLGAPGMLQPGKYTGARIPSTFWSGGGSF